MCQYYGLYLAWWWLKEPKHVAEFFTFIIDYTSQQDFGTQKVYCVSNVTFHAESKYAIKIFPSPTVFFTMAFLIIDFSEFLVFSSVIF